jgi:hypothetical protein
MSSMTFGTFVMINSYNIRPPPASIMRKMMVFLRKIMSILSYNSL